MMTTPEIREYLGNPAKLKLRYFPHKVAEELSDLAAILLYDLRVRTARRKKPNIRDNRSWTYDAMRVFAEDHGYAVEPGIRKAMLQLEGAKLIEIDKTGQHNDKPYDRKWWYHVTAEGIAKCRQRLIRYYPPVAEALDIPKAVILQHFRYEATKEGADEYVRLDPSDFWIPYSSRTISRHLNALVVTKILHPHPKKKHLYRVFITGDEIATPIPTKTKPPLTVSPRDLLPRLQRDQVGLLVGHSGTGKTSYSIFAAVQNAVAGRRVLYISLEEPSPSIVHRMYAQEYCIDYAALHQGDADAHAKAEAAHKEGSDRTRRLGENLRIIALKNPTSAELRASIEKRRTGGFDPDLVIIDQLEHIKPTDAEIPSSISELKMPENLHGAALPPALCIRDCFDEGEYEKWVLHQVRGAATRAFSGKDLDGGIDVANCFDCIIGIGREEGDDREMRVFSLTPGIPFEKVVEVDFPHMQFKPKKE